jgi:hypothetical protein
MRINPGRLRRRRIRPPQVVTLLSLMSLLAFLTALATPASAQAGKPAGRTATTATAPQVHYYRGSPRRIQADPSVPGHMPKGSLPRTSASTRYSPEATTVVTSSNWSGYADRACNGCQIRYIQANFNPREINCSGVTSNGTHDAAEWAGLNGLGDNTIQQIGWDSYCDGTAVHSYLWYENFPNNFIQFNIAGWHTGDEFTAEVYSASQNSYTMTLVDDTLGSSHQFTTPTLPCPQAGQCANTSAEVIAEVSGGGPTQGHYLANFNQFNPYEATVTSLNGTHGNMGTGSLWGSEEFVMRYPGTTLMAEPGSLINTGNDSSFVDTWYSAG